MQHTFSGHRWRVRQEGDGRLLQEIKASSNPFQTLFITDPESIFVVFFINSLFLLKLISMHVVQSSCRRNSLRSGKKVSNANLRGRDLMMLGFWTTLQLPYEQRSLTTTCLISSTKSSRHHRRRCTSSAATERSLLLSGSVSRMSNSTLPWLLAPSSSITAVDKNFECR